MNSLSMLLISRTSGLWLRVSGSNDDSVIETLYPTGDKLREGVLAGGLKFKRLLHLVRMSSQRRKGER